MEIFLRFRIKVDLAKDLSNFHSRVIQTGTCGSPIFLWNVQTIFLAHYCLFQSHTVPFPFVKAKFVFNLSPTCVVPSHLLFVLQFLLRLLEQSPLFFQPSKWSSPSSPSRLIIQRGSLHCLCVWAQPVAASSECQAFVHTDLQKAFLRVPSLWVISLSRTIVCVVSMCAKVLWILLKVFFLTFGSSPCLALPGFRARGLSVWVFGILVLSVPLCVIKGLNGNRFSC